MVRSTPGRPRGGWSPRFERQCSLAAIQTAGIDERCRPTARPCPPRRAPRPRRPTAHVTFPPATVVRRHLPPRRALPSAATPPSDGSCRPAAPTPPPPRCRPPPAPAQPPPTAAAIRRRLSSSAAAVVGGHPPPLLPLPSAVTSHLYGSCRPPPPHPCLPLPSSAGHRPTARAAATAGAGAAPANGHRDLLALPLPWRTAAFRRNPAPDGQCSPAARSSLWRPPLAIPLRQELLFIGTPPSTTAAALSVPVWQPPPSLALLWRRLERSRPSSRFLLVRADRQRRRLLPLRGRLLRPAASIR